MAKVLNWPVFFHIPKIMIKLILGELSKVILESQDVYPKEFESNGFKFKYSTLEYALEN